MADVVLLYRSGHVKCRRGPNVPVVYTHVRNGSLICVADEIDSVQQHADQGTNPQEALGVGYIGKNQSRIAITEPQRVAMAYAEADSKLTHVTSDRWRILVELLAKLDVEAPVAPGEIVVVVYRVGDAIWNEASLIDHPAFVTQAYLNCDEVTKNKKAHDDAVERMEGEGARKDTSGFVYIIMFSKRIMQLLVEMPKWPGSMNNEVRAANTMPKYATWLEYAKELRSELKSKQKRL